MHNPVITCVVVLAQLLLLRRQAHAVLQLTLLIEVTSGVSVHGELVFGSTLAPILPSSNPGTNVVTFPVAKHSTYADGDKDGANHDQDDLPDLHSVQDWWQVRSTCWDDNIWRRLFGGHDLVSQQCCHGGIVVQSNLTKSERRFSMTINTEKRRNQLSRILFQKHNVPRSGANCYGHLRIGRSCQALQPMRHRVCGVLLRGQSQCCRH